jgi:hypothetical protein
MKPGIHCVRTQWIRGFNALKLPRRTRIVMLMVPVGPESGFQERAVRRRPINWTDVLAPDPPWRSDRQKLSRLGSTIFS